jgi:hypothetical protein
MHPMILQGDEAQVEACLSPFGDSGNLDARKCVISVECTIGSKVGLDTPDGTPR